MDSTLPPEPREEDHRGGSWKVAYADFVTALMALFIVLWIMNAGRDVQEAVSGYFRNPAKHTASGGVQPRRGSGELREFRDTNVAEVRDRLEQAMAELPGFQKFAKYVKFSLTAEGLRIEMLENEGGVFFVTGSPRPTEFGERLFGLLAQELCTLPNPLAIEGHTDGRAFRAQNLDSYGNWELSFDRANMARRVMVAKGLRPEQILEIRGYADRRLLVPSDPADSRNRRVSVVMKYGSQ